GAESAINRGKSRGSRKRRRQHLGPPADGGNDRRSDGRSSRSDARNCAAWTLSRRYDGGARIYRTGVGCFWRMESLADRCRLASFRGRGSSATATASDRRCISAHVALGGALLTDNRSDCLLRRQGRLPGGNESSLSPPSWTAARLRRDNCGTFPVFNTNPRIWRSALSPITEAHKKGA